METTLENELVKRVEAIGGEAYKVQRLGKRGWPDREVLVSWMETQYVECKDPDNPYAKLNPQQRATHKRLVELNKSVWLLHTWDDLDYFINFLLANKKD